MRLALLSDVHGNYAALEAVARELGSVDAVVFCGDAVGYYPDADACCEWLRSAGAHAVRGNHDAYVTGALAPDPAREPLYRTGWTRQALSADNLRWLRTLPVELRFLLDGGALAVRHASPWDEETYLYPDSPRLDEIELAEREVLCLGHTHHPMLRRAGAGLVVNPGSVGQPRDRDPRASYAVLDTASGAVEHRRAAYDVERLQAALCARGWDERAISILNRTR
jgi:predicted phosphodiesterase